MSELTYHEAYGEVSKKELAAIRKHNVSPSDLMMLREVYGYDNHDTITAAIKEFTLPGGSFSEYDMILTARAKGMIL